MDIDVNWRRDIDIKLNGLDRADEVYTLYYDETNNHRVVRITDDGLNEPEPKCFVLGGIAHGGPPRELPFAELRAMLRLQFNVSDLKLKHLGKGDILELLDSTKVEVFLNWLEQEGFYVHYQALDPLYWGTVDVIDSIIAEARHSHLAAFAWELKDSLNRLLRVDFASVVTLFRVFDYPNVGPANRVRFLAELIALLNSRRAVLPEFEFQMLRGVLELGAELDALPFLEGEEPHLLVAHYRDFYAARLCLLKNAHHILDQEDVVSREISTWRFMDGPEELKHFRFARSHDEAGIQISDPVAGLLGKLFVFVINLDEKTLLSERKGLRGRQRASAAALSRIISSSIDENMAFANHVMSLSDQRKLWMFLEL